MKCRQTVSAALALALSLPAGAMRAGSVPDLSAESLGDHDWRQRARGFESGRIDGAPVERALRSWQEALAERPESLELRFKLLEGLYFKGHFLESDERTKRRLFDRLVALAEETVEIATPAEERRVRARAHFWAAISWGLWGMSHGYVRAGARGVAGKIRHHARAVIDLDPEIADAGGLRLLGRLHTATPKIPLLTGWIDRRAGIEMLRRAYRISTRDARNALFLAEALLDFEPRSRDEAIELLRQVAARRPDPEQLVEQSEILDRARRLLRAAEQGAL
jgi:tetratricopeptide (TPR) repeat protein